jgi:hypothetical protein
MYKTPLFVMEQWVVQHCRVEYLYGMAPTVQISPFPFHSGQSKGEV